MNRLLPAVGDELLLEVPHTEQVLVRVAAEGPGWFDLELLEHPRTPEPQLVQRGLMIEFINDEGVARLHGRLDAPGYRRAAGSATTSVRFAHRGSPQLLRRREFVRAGVEFPLTLTRVEGDEPVVASARALDLSGGGMLVGGVEGLRLGDQYAFDLQLAEGEPGISGRCEVVRVETANRGGLRFVELDEAARVRLTHFAFEMSREQHRRVA